VSSLDVIVCTHNPHEGRLRQALDALAQQSLSFGRWSLLLIDNASKPSLAEDLVVWHPHGRVIREPELGLTHARLRAIAEATSDLLVWVDDDNLLDCHYLALALAAFDESPRLGAAGGKSLPVYESPPPPWYQSDLAPLGCRDLGDSEVRMTWDQDRPTYPPAAPVGAGMVTRRTAIQTWAQAVTSDPDRQRLGRTGTALSSGEDNDINLTILRNGWDLAYLPALRLQHIIPPDRLTADYLKRIARASFRDFVRVLAIHGIRPWKPIQRWSVPLRKLRAWLKYRAWESSAAAIRWHGAVGQFEGRAEIRHMQRVSDATSAAMSETRDAHDHSE
jgi:glycosyltransferase involved in cell wall biosynthesis